MRKFACLAVGVALLCVGYVQADEVPFVELKGHTDIVLPATFSPDGKKIVTGSADKTARIWDAETGKELHKLEGHTDAVLYGNMSPDGKKIGTGGYNGPVRIWDVESGKELYRLAGENATFFPDGEKIVTNGRDENGNSITRFYDAKSGKKMQQFEGFFYIFSPDEKKFVTVHKDDIVKIWNTESEKVLQKMEGSIYPDMMLNGRILVLQRMEVVGRYHNHKLDYWDLESGTKLHPSESEKERFFVTHDEKKIFVISKALDSMMEKWAATSSDGKWIITVSTEIETFIFKIWDAESGKELHKLQAPFAEQPLVFSPDGKRFFTACTDGFLRVWDIESGKEQKLKGSGMLYPRAFSPDGKKVVVADIMGKEGDGDNTARIWTLE